MGVGLHRACFVKYESFSGCVVPDGYTDQWESRESKRAHVHAYANSAYHKSTFLSQ